MCVCGQTAARELTYSSDWRRRQLVVNVTTREGPQERRGVEDVWAGFGCISVQTYTLYSLVNDDVLLTCESESQSVDSTL